MPMTPSSFNPRLFCELAKVLDQQVRHLPRSEMAATFVLSVKDILEVHSREPSSRAARELEREGAMTVRFLLGSLALLFARIKEGARIRGMMIVDLKQAATYGC